MQLRRWDAAKTHRLNAARKARPIGATINDDLASYQETLRTLATREAASNPLVEGVLFSHGVDIVGPHGPTLQVQSDNEAYNQALEAVWSQWWKRPLTNRRRSGASLLRLWIRDLWTAGEFFAQKLTKKEYGGPVKLRLLPIHPRRVGTPMDKATSDNVVLGIEFDDDGDPVRYFVQKYKPGSSYLPIGDDYDEIDADKMIHGFPLVEEDQARGVPWLSSTVDTVGDLRDYDFETLVAARQAARQSMFWYADHPDAPYIALKGPESHPYEAGTQQAGPPGWKPQMLTPTQPAAQYVEYRKERQAELGRPVGMPLMHIRLDAGRHNYSSARYDGQNYQRGLMTLQGWVEDETLNPLVDDVAREAELAGAVPKRPEKVTYKWTWPKLPHVDPQREANAEDTGLNKNRTLTFPQACAGRGTDEDTVIEQWKRTYQKIKKAELPDAFLGGMSLNPAKADAPESPSKKPDEPDKIDQEDDDEDDNDAD